MGKRLLYINLDGFGKYYYDDMPDRTASLPGLARLKRRGCFFANAFTGIPSITFPMQSAIVSGCYSEGTGNCDKLWDREKNEVRLLQRMNSAETIGEVLAKRNRTSVSIQQFALENRGCSRDNPRRLYVQPGGDYRIRFDILERLLLKKEIEAETGKILYDELPEAIFLYIDDLDTLGHNSGRFPQSSEQGRKAAVQERLREIDGRIGSLLDILEKQGEIEEFYLLLTTDHGMVAVTQDRTLELKEALERWGIAGIHCCWQGAVPRRTEALMTGHGIQCQLYLPRGMGTAEQEALKQYLEKLDFVEQVLTREELNKREVCTAYADMLVSPVEGVGFSFGRLHPGRLYASHDSLHEKCLHIFAALAGPDIKRDYVETTPVRNIDFIPALAERLGWGRPEKAKGSLPDTVFI